MLIPGTNLALARPRRCTDARLEVPHRRRGVAPPRRRRRPEVSPRRRQRPLGLAVDGARDADHTVPFVVTTRQARTGLVSLTELNDHWGNAAVSYRIAPDQRGEGYGSEAVELTVGYWFDHLRYHKILAHTFASNDASVGLLESVGFRKEGHHRNKAFVDGEYRDLLAYGLLEDEWRERDAQSE